MTVRRVAVLGAGAMGHGIAQVCAQAGCEVRVYDPAPGSYDRARRRVRANLEKGLTLGKVSEAELAETMQLMFEASEIEEAVAGADLLIEAAPESVSLKKRLIARAARAAPEGAVFATNTSSISIGELASAACRPSLFLGMHFFNPVHLMPLVEVVTGPKTSDETKDAAVAFALRIGKEPIVVGDSPGFASTRLGIALGMEAIRMVEEEVASPEDIDRAMELGYRHPMGPLRLTDLVGLDVRLAIAEELHRELGGSTFEPPELLRRMVGEGRLGRKSGRGFYRWPTGESS